MDTQSWDWASGYLDNYEGSVHDVAVVDHGEGGVAVYVATRRRGIEVLKFDPNSQITGAPALQRVGFVQTPDVPYSLELRDIPGRGQDLVVIDYKGGLRVYAE